MLYGNQSYGPYLNHCIFQEAMDTIDDIQEEITLMQLDLKQAFITCSDSLAYDGCQGCQFCDKGTGTVGNQESAQNLCLLINP